MTSRIITETWEKVESAVIEINDLIKSLEPKYAAAMTLQDQAQKNQALEILRRSLDLLELTIYDDLQKIASEVQGYHNLGGVSIIPHEKLFLPHGQEYVLSPKIDELLQAQNIQGVKIMQDAFNPSRILYDVRPTRPLQSDRIFLSSLRAFLRDFTNRYPGYTLTFDWTVQGPLAVVNTDNGNVGCTRYGFRVYGYSLVDSHLPEQERITRRELVSGLGSLYGITKVEQQERRRFWFRN